MRNQRETRRRRRFGTVVAERLENLDLPDSWRDECVEYVEELRAKGFLQGRSMKRVLDSVLLLLCRKHGFPAPKELRADNYLGILRILDGVNTPRTDHYIRNFFAEYVGYSRFQEKALDIASKLPRELHGRKPSILAAACIYISSIDKMGDQHRPLITQSELAEFFKITNVSIMTVYPRILRTLKSSRVLLSDEEIKWLLSFRKEQLERC